MRLLDFLLQTRNNLCLLHPNTLLWHLSPLTRTRVTDSRPLRNIRPRGWDGSDNKEEKKAAVVRVLSSSLFVQPVPSSLYPGPLSKLPPFPLFLALFLQDDHHSDPCSKKSVPLPGFCLAELKPDRRAVTAKGHIQTQSQQKHSQFIHNPFLHARVPPFDWAMAPAV